MRACAGVALALGVFVSACRRGDGADPDGPRLEVRWSGQDSARVAAEATAEWCESLRLLEVRAVAGDTGVALALYPSAAFGPGRYGVRPPLSADSTPPGAALGLRWFAETSIRGFQGDSGVVLVEAEPGGTYGGTFEATAHSVTDGGHLAIQGSFHHLVVRPATRGCTSRPPHPPPGAGVH